MKSRFIRPRANTTTEMNGAAPGAVGPGLTVVKVKTPVLPTALRPKPVKV